MLLDGLPIFAEEGGNGTFTVVLQSVPQADVFIGVSTASPGLLNLSASTLTFTNGDWNVPQKVDIITRDDDIDRGSSYTASVSLTVTSTDPAYANSAAAPFTPGSVQTVTIFDNDNACRRDCPAGETSVACNGTDVCVPAAPGTYSLGGCDPPIDCPAGTEQPEYNASSDTQCLPCS